MNTNNRARIQTNLESIVNGMEFQELSDKFDNIIHTRDEDAIEASLYHIARILKRIFNIETKFSIIDRTGQSPFFGFNLFPTFEDIKDISVKVLSNSADDIIDIWQNIDDWYVEIDSNILYNSSKQFNAKEIATLLLYRIEQVVFNYELPEKVTMIVRQALTSLDYRSNAVARSAICRDLYIIPFLTAAGYVNYTRDLPVDSMLRATPESEQRYRVAFNKILTNFGMLETVDRNATEFEHTLNYVLLMIFESINDMKYSTRTLRFNVKKYVDGLLSNYVKAVMKKIFIKFTNVNGKVPALEASNPKMKEMQEKIAEQHIVEQVQAIYESTKIIQEFIDKHGFVKKVDNKEIDIIRIEISDMETSDDKIFLIERVYKFLSIVNYSLSLLDDPELGKRVRVSKSMLQKQKSELEELRQTILEAKIAPKKYGLYVKYPVGYEG